MHCLWADTGRDTFVRVSVFIYLLNGKNSGFHEEYRVPVGTHVGHYMLMMKDAGHAIPLNCMKEKGEIVLC